VAYPSLVASNSQAQIDAPTIEAIDDSDALNSARVIVLGAGGLGSAAARALAEAGVDLLGLVDETRAEALAARLRMLEPEVQIDSYPARLETANAGAIVAGHDLVVDCSNSEESRLAVNDACIVLGVPLVTATLCGSTGSLTTVQPGVGPCCRCILGDFTSGDVPGSAAPKAVHEALAGVVGSLEGMEAVKLITGAGAPLSGRILRVDALTQSFDEIVVARRVDCPSCGDL
jgi:molybdopterin/thiamine biosynthesis adenylyltransferase